MEDTPVVPPNSSSPHSTMFLNRSGDTSTLPTNLASNPDDRPIGRQKRKRTSPEDQAILQDAYQKDPKPDKAARLKLAELVTLGEKEVQIWFQNRRQTSRRKTRPLLPHEIAHFQMYRSGTDALSIAGSFDAGTDESTLDDTQTEQKTPESSAEDDAEDEPSPPHDTTLPPATQSPVSVVPVQVTPVLSDPAISIGYLANRRSAPALRHSLSEHFVPPTAAVSSDSAHGLKRSSSFVRLSMNAQGKAEVVTKDAASPSPPRPQQSSIVYDNPGFVPQPRGLTTTGGLQRSSSGRSRDSRSWEFWCDKDARSELENAAENDASGSAVGAISLLRTASGRNILGSVPSKRNSTLTRNPSARKRSKLDSNRPPLQRSSTSMGRMQSRLGQHRQSPKLKHSESSISVYGKGTDSDKENWSPDPESTLDAQDSALERQYGNRGRQNDRSQQTYTQSSLKSGAQKDLGDTATDPENDAELAAFMRGGRRSGSVSGDDDDLDCVQGLLSLSQGNWR